MMCRGILWRMMRVMLVRRSEVVDRALVGRYVKEEIWIWKTLWLHFPKICKLCKNWDSGVKYWQQNIPLEEPAAVFLGIERE